MKDTNEDYGETTGSQVEDSGTQKKDAGADVDPELVKRVALVKKCLKSWISFL